jgi:hypothetical protein
LAGFPVEPPGKVGVQAVMQTQAIQDGAVSELLLAPLRRSWPLAATVQLPLAELGARRLQALLVLVRTLSDGGLLTYEGLHVGVERLEIADAALTARGRTMLSALEGDAGVADPAGGRQARYGLAA